MNPPLPLILVILTTSACLAQQPSQEQPASPPEPTNPPATANINAPVSSSGGSSSNFDPQSIFSILPQFNPGEETVTWNGQTWNILNNRLFEARFEKYLNAPPVPAEEDQQYQAILDQMELLLAPGRASATTVDQAFALLPRASDFHMDEGICDAVSSAVYNVWLARREDQRITSAIDALEQERRRHESNLLITGSTRQLDRATSAVQRAGTESKTTSSGTNSPDDSGQTTDTTVTTVTGVDSVTRTDQQIKRLPHVTRIAEVNAALLKARSKQELPLFEARVHYQAMMVHLFAQRRFNHVIIAAQFYRNLFGSGNEKIELRGEAERLFSGSSGLPPTVSVLESMAYAFIREAKEGVEAFEYLLTQNELASASKRLSEAFMIGEYLAPLRRLPREQKREVLGFMRTSNKLISAISVKDYTGADALIAELEEMATDFDVSKPRAAVETARTVATFHLAKAKNAALSGDTETLEKELTAATEIWPRNPALKEVSSLLFRQGDVQQRALIDLDQLLSQKNYRRIFEDRARFIAAVSLAPDREAELNAALERVQKADTVIAQAREIAKRGDVVGAWESVERIHRQIPDDTPLNELRANLTTEAADFVRALRTAEDLEERNQTGSSLAWYLEAIDLYPNSHYAREGIDRIVADLFGEAKSSASPDEAPTLGGLSDS